MAALAEDLMLLLLDDEFGRPVVDKMALNRVMAGAVLLELADTGRASGAEPDDDVKAGRLIVRDSSSIGDEVLDTAVRSLLEVKPLKGSRAVELLATGSREDVLRRLAARGHVRAEETKIFGLFPIKSWSIVDSGHKQRVRRQVHSVLFDGDESDSYVGGLVALLHAVRAVHKVFHGDKKRLHVRAEEIADGEWASDEVRKSVDQVRDAAAAAVISAGGAGGQ